MSFLASGVFGNYDHTGQTAGVPPDGHARRLDYTDEEIVSPAGHTADGANTRTTSLTETGSAPDGISRGEKEVAPSGNNGSSDDEDDDQGTDMQRRTSRVQELARHYTNVSMASGVVPPGSNPFTELSNADSPLNPNGEKFSARAWAKAVVQMIQSEGHHFRTSGVAFQNLNVFGHGEATDYQKDFLNVWLEGAGIVRRMLKIGQRQIDILQNFDGVVRKGEMLVVLGPPGAGCTTLLKTIAGETNGLFVDDKSYFNYQGLAAHEMHTRHRGEAIYTAEVDVHFPQLSVGDTLTFAARARAPRTIPGGVPRHEFAHHLRDVVMAMYGISHTVNTRVGNEYVRGVSGGERKRVTIAEATLSGAPLQCWDNSTRGLDSANAVEFVKTLRLQTELFGNTAVVSIYQAPQSAYDLFDKVLLIYEGRQIYFGPTAAARQYFIDLGFYCADRATTPDFLTSMTSPKERIDRKGFEGRTPRTPDEFAAAWRNSDAYKAVQADIEDYKQAHPIDGPDAVAFRELRREQQASAQRPKSPFTLSYGQQISLCLWRGFRRLIGDPSVTLSMLFGNFFMSLIVASVYYNLQPTTASFFQRGALLFFACLMNAFSSALEILTLYSQRPIVEKHARYALYHPSAEAVASMLCDMPYKIGNTIMFNLALYFMTNLRREPGPFFFYLLISFTTVLVMSMIFRTIGSASRTLSQAMVPAAVIILALVIFTGFVIPIDYMHGWCRWINYIDPLAYSFESLMVNEFHNRQFLCNVYVPSATVAGYENVTGVHRVCSAVGSVVGSDYVDGDRYLNLALRYYHAHKWRNFGILCGFVLFFLFTYIVAAELVSEKKSKGEVLVFRRGGQPKSLTNGSKGDAESGSRGPGTAVASGGESSDKEGGAGFIDSQRSVFHWQDVCYEVKIKAETRRILDHVDGWVKPGTLTALMGVSGAGKTTLLDVLADRTSMGVITGDMFVDGHERDHSFQRKTGYVQQQDLHLETTTVREALNFSALLRQPAHVPRQEKLAYVDEVIKLLEMDEYADAVVGVPGEGLNVEQRKRLTIGVELAAKPPLLLFVDEPTSGLDSQTSWAILDLLEKLTKSGQAVLCTIHQPSAMLFQRFDRLLFLARGGRTVYFGEIGKNSHTMTSYFERNGGHACPADANPAEWMLEVIGAAPGTSSEVDWRQAWLDSPEYAAVKTELLRLREHPAEQPEATAADYREFAAPFAVQVVEVSHRVFQQYWRTPSYIYSKMALCVLVALFVGFSFFKAPLTIQGVQNQMFALFQLLTVFGQMVQQTMPYFVIQRSLYEVRERPSKVYSWRVFMLSQIVAELPWNTLMAVLMFFCWYYPVGLYANAGDALHERGVLMFLFLWCFLLFTSTFTDMIIAGFETAEAGGNIANLLFMMCLIFCGVLASPSEMPHFWIFMYRVSPFNYLISGMLVTGIANSNVTCAANEFVTIVPVNNQTCLEYMGPYMQAEGGYLLDNNARDPCGFCKYDSTNTLLSAFGAEYGDRWRNFGILWAYIIFNIGAALGVYWLFRVPKHTKTGGKHKAEKPKKVE
ncbi:ABC transporter cdr4 [Grosmannia clavigera kw1407]|uniref:ABC transporter cdr4 n=1 Tax=Grosmannia clavigera (strain kw1407 / UAMH 11150) TaxID=655863 RepID=F0XP73_GROCL|nr:ABC transporter cdr4 [Grosmannia clavigera kw1407]EFX00255.1 ABC transporter cdr4 [Grosmannia clavigera kw1407]